MKKRNLIALLACGVISMGATVGLAGCSEDVITVWGAQNQQTMLQEMIEEFQKKNPDVTTKIKLGVCGESEAYAQISKDPEQSPDVFGYANDQLVNLRKINALAKLGPAAEEFIKTNNDEGSVESGKLGDAYYGYPYASDNGYFLYYDKSVVKETSLGKLELILNDCKAKKKSFIYNQREPWYVGTFFYGCGGDYTLEWGGANGTTLVSSKCNFDQKPEGENYTYGQIGGQAHIDLNANPAFKNGDDTVVGQDLGGGLFGACVSGTWNATRIKNALGDNYGAVKLPTFHSSLTDKDYQMNSFIGYKLYGVSPYSKHAAEAHRIAQFLSSKEMQEKRYDTLQTGPSNKEVAAMQKVKDNIALAAFAAQREAVNGVKIQESLPSGYWDAMKGFGEGVNGTTPSITTANLDEQLAKVIKALNTNSSDEA